MLDLALLLRDEGVNPAEVIVLRHRPPEAKLRNVLPWLAVERPAVFNAYQSTHSPRTEAALTRARFVASFIGHKTGRAAFVGLYAVEGHRPVTLGECRSDPDYEALFQFGMAPWQIGKADQTVLRFDLSRLEILANLSGHLIVDWPKPELAWYRWGGQNIFPIRAILEQSVFAPAMPAWQDLIVSWPELQALPTSWKTALAQWRGIYLIHDASDGQRYVGSACGNENMLGRWLDYAASGHGGNKLLRQRDPAGFAFSILQRLSPDLPADEVIAIENGWKTRLHTRHPLGLNAN